MHLNETPIAQWFKEQFGIEREHFLSLSWYKDLLFCIFSHEVPIIWETFRNFALKQQVM